MSTSQPPNLNRYPCYSPRFWHGMSLRAYLDLLRIGRGKISPSRLPMAAILFGVTSINSIGGLLQRLLYTRAIQNFELDQPPIFILGHWRSGTTLLHELLLLDERFSAPNTYQCFAPHHFLLSEGLMTRLGGWMLPAQRPMDNMAAGWRRPQEDEFALMNLGMPSSYRRIAFPQEPPVDTQMLDWQEIPASVERTWVETWSHFVRAVSYRTQKRLVLKSPTHTGRIGLLHKHFPDAKFIHITRDPRKVFPSTCRLWHSLDLVQALQTVGPNHQKELEPYVAECGRRMYAAFHAARPEVPASHIVDCRYEDLIADPQEELRRIYEALHLEDFSEVEPILDQWIRSHHREYQTNRHSLDEETEAWLRNEWSDYFESYGYDAVAESHA